MNNRTGWLRGKNLCHNFNRQHYLSSDSPSRKIPQCSDTLTPSLIHFHDNLCKSVTKHNGEINVFVDLGSKEPMHVRPRGSERYRVHQLISRAGGRLAKSLAAKMASQIFGYRL